MKAIKSQKCYFFLLNHAMFKIIRLRWAVAGCPLPGHAICTPWKFCNPLDPALIFSSLKCYIIYDFWFGSRKSLATKLKKTVTYGPDFNHFRWFWTYIRNFSRYWALNCRQFDIKNSIWPSHGLIRRGHMIRGHSLAIFRPVGSSWDYQLLIDHQESKLQSSFSIFFSHFWR